jgi:hypothetical protein
MIHSEIWGMPVQSSDDDDDGVGSSVVIEAGSCVGGCKYVSDCNSSYSWMKDLTGLQAAY